jgi:hypothetical protein
MNRWMKKQRIQLKAFGEYLKDKPLARLLHRARKESLKRIESHEGSIDLTRTRVPQKRTGTR